MTVPVSPDCDTGRHYDCTACDCTCHKTTTGYQQPRDEGETP